VLAPVNTGVARPFSASIPLSGISADPPQLPEESRGGEAPEVNHPRWWSAHLGCLKSIRGYFPAIEIGLIQKMRPMNAASKRAVITRVLTTRSFCFIRFEERKQYYPLWLR